MFYRRKILLHLLQASGGMLEKLRLQKLVFLITNRQPEPTYDFVPYKFGCFSFSLQADLGAMHRRGIILETETGISAGDVPAIEIDASDRKVIADVMREFGETDARGLMKHTYEQFPWWATRSQVAESVVSAENLQRIETLKKQGGPAGLYTIGYEGRSLEAYFNRLLQHGIAVLVDVRRNPQSMKYGFSLPQLKRYCEYLDIQYLHMPEVGIAGDRRKTLNTQADYDELFAAYCADTLPVTGETQRAIYELIEKHRRVAITCFEAEICRCHRTPLAHAILERGGGGFPLLHI
jgi:uncharacterized protein (DUF488 family)